jgi:signal transduction histidine kinase
MLTLVGSVTRHDVLNQLTAIAGYNDLLSMMTEDQKLTAFLAKEKKAIEKIRLLFQYSKEYQNLGAEPPRWQMLRNVIARMSEEADTTSFRIQDLTKNASVCADPLFERVFYHLFNNAGQHGDRVSEVRISLCETTSGALLIIEDDGAGILAGDKQKIFDRGQGKNTGWGLFLVREILSQSGMTIAETGEPGKGARFEIRIPFGKYRFF